MRGFSNIKGMVRKNRKMFYIAVIAAVAVSVSLFCGIGSGTDVKTAFVVRGDISNVIEQTGTVETAKKQDIYAMYGGRIKSIPVEVGQTVEEGQLLLEFDRDELYIRLSQAEAGLALTEGGTAINAEAAAALAAYEEAAVERDRAKEAFKSTADLFEIGAVSDADIRRAKETFELSETKLNAAAAALEKAKKADKSQQASAEAAGAEVSLIKRQIDEATVHSSIKGIVLETAFEEGMTVPAGNLIMRIGSPDRLQVRCKFLAGEAVDIKEGDDALITGDLLNDTVLKGSVKKVHPQAITEMSHLGMQQQRVPVEIELKETHNNLKPGFSIDVEVITDRAEDVLMVPKDAVFEMDGGHSVFVVKDKRAVLKRMHTGIGNKDRIQVLDGLNEKDVVILEPPNEIKEGARVRIK